MGVISRKCGNLRWGIIFLSAAVLMTCWLFRAGQSGRADESKSSYVRDIPLGRAHPDTLYALTVWVKNPAQLQGNDAILATVRDGRGEIESKWLHSADLDFYLTLRPRGAGPISVSLSAPSAAHIPEIGATLRRIPMALAHPAGLASDIQPGVIAALPNGTWQAAQPFEFGQTIYGSNDERPYAPSRVEDAYQAMLKGFQWFKFTFHGKEPRLVYFVLNVTDRDVPLDVDIFQAGKDAGGQPDVVPYNKGEFVYQIEATQNYPGLYKFRTRILQPGQQYYIRLAANHPAFQLHTYDYPVPPYSDPHQAVRAGMDFLINMGDTWLSNTPRRGAVALRTTMQHSETQLCIACHPTQFSTRGYLTAVRNGYPPTQRAALEFLTDRIYNNARPLYGESNTNWVRVIYTARTVASRLPLITHSFEENVTHDPPRERFDLPYAEFLKIHYKGVTTMPGDESDGCEPDVSPFEIGTQSWQTFNLAYNQTHDAQWLAERDKVERLAVAAEPKNMIDLDWKILLLDTVDRAKYAAQIDKLIDQLYSYETPDGAWPYPFDKKAKPADFISYNAVYALAMAGRRPESDERMGRAVKAMLTAQRQEGSWEGDPVYQGFNTPFRATQFAVMTLSTLYPGTTTAKNWDAAYPPPPTQLATNDLPLLLNQLDQYWDLAPESVLRQIRRVLTESDQPLAREAAARAIGHMADPGSIPALIKALGDPSKMVQSSAAYALRMVLSRRETAAAEGRKLLAAALVSPDARTRWGAARLFNQHFKDLTGDGGLLAVLEHNLDDPVPFVRFEAASGLWRWYYWQVDRSAVRRSTLEALATRLNTETDPMVRRGLQESVYDLLDENTGYLTAWVRASSQDEDKRRIGEGYESAARDQAQVLAKVLREGTPLGREGLLNALWDFHIRHYALPPVKENTVAIGLPAVLTQYVRGVPDLHVPGYEYPPYREAVNFRYDIHNGFFQTRIGNDSDLIHFFKSSGPDLENALLACLQGADDPMKIEVLKAGSTLSGAGDERFTLAALDLAEDPSEDVRKTVRYVYEDGQRGILNLDAPAAPNPQLLSKVVEILEHGNPDSQAVVLPLLAALPADSPWGRQDEIMSALGFLLEEQPHPTNYAQVLNAVSSFETLMKVPALRRQVLAGLEDHDPEIQRAALRVSLEHFLNDPETAPLVKTAFGKLNGSALNILIEEVGDPKFMRRHLGIAGGAVSQDQQYFLGENLAYLKVPDLLDNPIVFDTVMSSLRASDPNVRAGALDVLRKVKNIEQRPEFRAAINELEKDSNPRLKLIASSVLEGKKLSEALKDVQPGSVLDFNYFVAKVEPILATPGADGKACVFCHASHVIFKLEPPNEQGVFSPQDSEENYRYAMRVVDINDPSHSLMLIKPTRPTDSAGNVGDYLATHNGGQRWPGNESSWQYRTIMQWIRGGRLENTLASK
jgi:HEAT repeat protein